MVVTTRQMGLKAHCVGEHERQPANVKHSFAGATIMSCRNTVFVERHNHFKTSEGDIKEDKHWVVPLGH